MQSRFQIFACLATLVALFAGRDVPMLPRKR